MKYFPRIPLNGDPVEFNAAWIGGHKVCQKVEQLTLACGGRTNDCTFASGPDGKWNIFQHRFSVVAQWYVFQYNITTDIRSDRSGFCRRGYIQHPFYPVVWSSGWCYYVTHESDHHHGENEHYEIAVERGKITQRKWTENNKMTAKCKYGDNCQVWDEHYHRDKDSEKLYNG